MSSKQRKYATILHPTIEAVVHALYRYPTHAKAAERLAQVRQHFVLAKDQPESPPDHPRILLWIKGYEVTPTEADQGFSGHYAELTVTTTDKGLFTISASKVLRPLASHPQKKRPKARHPNWGHPVMRAVKKQKRYATLEEATAELELLHTEFPEVSIPGQGKLFIIIYEKREAGARPTHKIALELKTHPAGGYIICWRDNQKITRPSSKQPPGTAETAAANTDPQGYFTSMVALGKLRKRRSNAKRPEIPPQPDSPSDS